MHLNIHGTDQGGDGDQTTTEALQQQPLAGHPLEEKTTVAELENAEGLNGQMILYDKWTFFFFGFGGEPTLLVLPPFSYESNPLQFSSEQEFSKMSRKLTPHHFRWTHFCGTLSWNGRLTCD